MFKKITWFTFCFLLSLFIVNTDRAEKIINNFFDYYPLEYPTNREVGFCRQILGGIYYSYATLTPIPEPVLSKYESRQLRNKTSAEKVLAYKKDIERKKIGSIDIYFNYDENLIQEFQKEFNLYLKEKNITVYDAVHLYLLQLQYLMENDNENALYVCDIWNDIGNYNYTEKRHREVIDLLSKRIFDS